MKALKYSDVYRRANNVKRMLENSTGSELRAASIIYESVRDNINRDLNIRLLFKACENDSKCANKYARRLAEIANDTVEYTNRYISSIVPNIDNNVLKDVIETGNISDSFRQSLKESYENNLVCDNLSWNHNVIMGQYDIQEFAHNKRVTSEMIANKICDLLENIEADDYGKFQAAVGESVLLFTKYDIPYNEHALVEYLSEYYSMRSDNKNIQRIMSKSVTYCIMTHILNEDFFGGDHESSSDVVRICNDFTDRGELTINSLNRFKNEIMMVEFSDLSANFNKYLNVLFRILLMEDQDELSNYILHNMVPHLYSDIPNNEDTKDIILRISWQKEKVDNYLSDYDPSDTVKRRLVSYRDTLNDVITLMNNDREVAYSEYNIMCIDDNRNELNKLMTLEEYKIFKFDNLITRTMKLDNYIQKKVEPSRNKIYKKIQDTNNEIFHSEEESKPKDTSNTKKFISSLSTTIKSKIPTRESVDILDTLTPDGDVDYCVATYGLNEDIDSDKLNKFLTSITMEANEEILNDTDLTCYYEITPDGIEFHVKEYANIQFTENEKTLIENHISLEDANRMLAVLSATYNLNEDFDYVSDSAKYFSSINDNKERIDRFKDFLELSSNMCIDKSIVLEAYDSICRTMGPNSIPFRYYCNDLVENYKPQINSNSTEILRTFTEMQLMLEGTHDEYNAVNTKDLSKYGYNGEDEKKKKSHEDNNFNFKVPEEPHKYEKPELAEDDYEDNVKDNPMKNMTPTNLKLMGKGVAKGVKDIGAKEQRASKMADAIFNRTIKNCKDALVSDRREAIIKGSVIPSFSKSIKIGLVLALLGVANPVAAVIAAIGGLAVSKKLTERERSLLLDDIEVELNVIDKELQMAEANNQMNKYRALMKMRKDLQRQYQRIRYNIKFKSGKNPLPSKTGVDSEE